MNPRTRRLRRQRRKTRKFDLKDEEQKCIAASIVGRSVVEALTEKNPKPLESNAWSSKRRG